VEIFLGIIAMLITLVALVPALQSGNLQMIAVSAVGLLICAAVYFYTKRQEQQRIEK
jgi:hypothetical protein